MKALLSNIYLVLKFTYVIVSTIILAPFIIPILIVWEFFSESEDEYDPKTWEKYRAV